MHVNSEIFRPRVYEALPADRAYTVFGPAWAGNTEVTGISLRSNGGRIWKVAQFPDPVQRHAWRRWSYEWLTPKKSGKYTLLCRAKDASGRVQPDPHDPNRGSYVIEHPLPIEVYVDD
jgi:hypothetical protein